GRRLAEIHDAEAYAFFEPHLRRAFAGEAVSYERAARGADGRSVWLSVNLSPHRDATGAVAGLFTCALEVRELKRTHDALGRALEEIAFHMENTPLGVVELGADLRIKRWSSQAGETFGWPFGEVRGRTLLEAGLVHPD